MGGAAHAAAGAEDTAAVVAAAATDAAATSSPVTADATTNDRGTISNGTTACETPPVCSLNEWVNTSTPRRKLPPVPPTPICHNYPTPRQTLLLHDEIAALKLIISELQARVEANTSAIGAMSGPPVSPDGIDRCAKKGEVYKQVQFTFPKRTATARQSTTITPCPITLSNRYDALPTEAVESEDTSLDSSSHITPHVPAISEQLQSYTRKQKAHFANRIAVAQVACPTPLLTEPQSSISVDRSRVSIPVSEQLQLYARKHSNNFANRLAVPQVANSTPLSTESRVPSVNAEQSRVSMPVREQPQSHTREHGSNFANQNAAPLDSSANPAPRKVVCVSDSMTRSIRNNFINQKLKQHSVEGSVNETVYMDLNPGGDTEKIKHSSKFMLQKHQPRTLIIVAGTNDISHDTRAGNADANAIAERIINIGKEAIRDFKCVEQIAISSIIIRGSAQYSDIVFDVNLRLRLKCIQEDFTYIDNECITKHDLYDGLHLNRFGNDKLLHKLLSCCESFNPCLADDLPY
jgi:hypothetical protein